MKKLALLAIAAVVICAMIGAGTFAYFTSTDSATATFTSGTLDMALGNNGVFGSGDDVTATWKSPANWAPGQKVTATLSFTNKGTIDARHIYFKFTGVSGVDNMMKKIIISNLQERFNSKYTGNQAAKIDQQVGNNDGILTLAEFVKFRQGSEAYYTWDDQTNDGVVIGSGNAKDYDLIMEFTFDPTADNNYQGAACGFNLVCRATQNSPTDGMVCLHEEASQQAAGQ